MLHLLMGSLTLTNLIIILVSRGEQRLQEHEAQLWCFGGEKALSLLLK